MSIKNKLQHIIKTSIEEDTLDNRICIDEDNSDNYLKINYIDKDSMTTSDKDYLFSNINKIINAGKNYGRSSYGSGKKVNMSYLSYDINNLNSIRKIVYGDSLTNILSFAGYDVTREYYYNDSYLEIKKELDNIRVSFDKFTDEKTLYSEGIVDGVLSSLKRSDKCYIKDNSLWLRTTDLFDSNDRILVLHDGSYSCFLLKISYYINRLSFGYDRIFDITFDNNDEEINGIRSSIEFAGYDSNKFEIINISAVEDKEEYNYKVDLNEILNSICVNDLRYSLITEKFGKDIKNNPIYFIEKSYSKVCYLLRGKTYEMVNKYSTIDNDIAYTILNKLTLFEDIIIDSVNKRSPNIIVSYLYELASLFNAYYDDESIITDDSKYTNERLLIITAIRIVMDNASNMLGLILREEM